MGMGFAWVVGRYLGAWGLLPLNPPPLSEPGRSVWLPAYWTACRLSMVPTHGEGYLPTLVARLGPVGRQATTRAPGIAGTT